MWEPKSRDELRAIVAIAGDELPLDRVLLHIAQEEYPDLSVDQYLGRLDALARAVRVRAGATGNVVAALRDELFGAAGFRGNEQNYYDPKNSMLNEVIDRRLGIPITLAIVYLEVARRVGTRAVGVGFPGHFLVRHELDPDDDAVQSEGGSGGARVASPITAFEGRALLIDPFARGATVRRADCERLLCQVQGPSAELEPWMLAPASPRAIVIRVLTNLKHAYMLIKDHASAVRAIDRLLIFDPSRTSELRDRGLLLAELDCVGAAVRDLETYLERGAPAPEVELVERVLPGLRKKIAQLN